MRGSSKLVGSCSAREEQKLQTLLGARRVQPMRFEVRGPTASSSRIGSALPTGSPLAAERRDERGTGEFVARRSRKSMPACRAGRRGHSDAKSVEFASYTTQF
jgi:hypothetical protein